MFKILYVINKVISVRDCAFINQLHKIKEFDLKVLDTTELKTFELSSDMKFDLVINFTKKLRVSSKAEHLGIPVINKPSSIKFSVDKWATYQKLKVFKIPQPKTSLTQDFPIPYIFKDRWGAAGEDVNLITDNFTLDNRRGRYIFQEYIAESAGKSVRVVMIDKKPVVSYSLKNTKSFKSNLAEGGTSQRCKLTPEMENLCIKAATVLDLDYCGVDLLESNKGWVVLEVNSSAGLKGVDASTRHMVANYFTDLVTKVLTNLKEMTND